MEAWSPELSAVEGLTGSRRRTGASGPRREASERGAEDKRRRGGTGKGEGRIGEARNPGPEIEEGEAGQGGAGMVEDAWARVRAESDWVPAWKAWSRQIVRPGGQDGRLRIALVPPLVAEEEACTGGGQAEWEEEELEAFLQQCELEAGLITETDADEARRRAGDWRAWEQEATMSGIECPRVQEQGEQGVRGIGPQGEEVERMQLPSPVNRRAPGDRGGDSRRRKQRWRPLTFQGREGEPPIEETLEVPHALPQDRGHDVEAAQRRPARTREVRPRGRRQRGGPAELFDVEVVTFNGSGTPQAVAALDKLREKSKKVAAVLVQEHLAAGDAVADLQHAARRVGFKIAPNEAAKGKGGGPSAGVALAVPLHRGWGGHPGPELGPVTCGIARPPGGSLDTGRPARRHVLLQRLFMDYRGNDSSECGAGRGCSGGGLGVRRSLGDRRGLERHPQRAPRGGWKADRPCGGSHPRPFGGHLLPADG